MPEVENKENKEKENKGPDVSKLIADGFSGLKAELDKLSQRVMATEQKPSQKQSKQETDDDLADMILLDPKKAVGKIREQLKESLMGDINTNLTAKEEFNMKYTELMGLYPEIADESSELHKRTKELFGTFSGGKFDAAQLERAALKAASEQGLSAKKHRKQAIVEEEEEYLGSGSFQPAPDRRGKKPDKLPKESLQFAELVGLNIKDPKVIERLEKTHKERSGNWNKYK